MKDKFEEIATAVYNDIQNYLGESDPRTIIALALKRVEKEGFKRGVQKGRVDAFEEWSRFAVKRMCYWKDEDLKESVEFRRGVEEACSDMCVYHRTRTSDQSSPYLERQAIEFAIKNCGMNWGDNKTRLNFYKHFESYIKDAIRSLKQGDKTTKQGEMK